MAKSRYSIEEKKKLVMAFREETGNQGFLNAEEIARWCNKTFKLVDKLYGRDFRRPEEMKIWFDEINSKITIKTGPKGKGVQVITASLIDIDHIIKTCRSADSLRAELRLANQRFQDVIDTDQALSKKLKEEKEARIKLERDIEIIKFNHDKAIKELMVKGRKWKSEKAEMKKRLKEKTRTEKELLQYICKYIADPIAADHFANELGLLVTHPGRKVVLPEPLKELANDDRPFGMIISAFDECFGVIEDDETFEFDEENVEDEVIVENTVAEPVEVITVGEATALSMLDNL